MRQSVSTIAFVFFIFAAIASANDEIADGRAMIQSARDEIVRSELHMTDEEAAGAALEATFVVEDKFPPLFIPLIVFRRTDNQAGARWTVLAAFFFNGNMGVFVDFDFYGRHFFIDR